MFMKLNVIHWWNDNGAVKFKYLERNLSQRYFFHHKAHIQWPDISLHLQVQAYHTEVSLVNGFPVECLFVFISKLHSTYISLSMFFSWFDVCGSVHHSIIHIKNPTRCNSVSGFYFRFIWSSTCFGRHTAHHQEPKTALADSVQQLHVQQPFMYAKPEAASAVLGSWWWAVCHPKHVELHINLK
jgi:hypothetical protein